MIINTDINQKVNYKEKLYDIKEKMNNLLEKYIKDSSEGN